MTLLGRLTRDPEVRNFSGGGKVCQIGFATNNRKKNAQTGQWEDEPMFIDCKLFQGGQGTGVDNFERLARKGAQVLLSGRLTLETWDDKATGQKRSKHVVTVSEWQLCDPPRQNDDGAPSQARPSAERDAARHAAADARTDDSIPF